MSSKELDLDFEFSNEELANFLENFSEKIREGEVGLSFKGREEVKINPSEANQLEMEYEDKDTHRELALEITLRQQKNVQEQDGRKKIQVEIA
ncbi:MAG: amphi-Trp domain-containing protein [Candidatus Nanohaloarchaea archaeon]